jgi:hypothetical protein
MPWTTITANDVLTEFTPAETAMLQNIQGANTQLAAIVTKVVKGARSQINAGGNQLDQTGLTVPDALVEDVIAISRWRWLISFPTLKAMQTDARKNAATDAEARLRDIASQKADRERTELPPAVDTTPVPLVQPSTGNSKRKNFRREDGIV